MGQGCYRSVGGIYPEDRRETCSAREGRQEERKAKRRKDTRDSSENEEGPLERVCHKGEITYRNSRQQKQRLGSSERIMGGQGSSRGHD